MPKIGRRVKVRGAKRMQDLGYKSSQIWMDPVQHKTLKAAADRCGLTLTAFVLRAAIAAARGEFLG